MNNDMLQRLEVLLPTFEKYMGEKGYATASDCRTIIAKWYDFLEWLQNIGNSLDKSGGI